jgi:hypothetical protein
MPDVLKRYVEGNGLPLGKTVEETLNTVLESLRKQPENRVWGEFRNELISSCAVSLNGLGKIKDPVRLFKNLGMAFESRQHCIYTKTVANALNRVYLDAVKQKKMKEVFSVWKSFRNEYTRAVAGRHIPLEDLLPFLNSENRRLQDFAAETLAHRKNVPKNVLEGLFNHSNTFVAICAARSLALQRTSTEKVIEEMLKSKNDAVRIGVAEAIPLKNFEKTFLEKLLRHPDNEARLEAAKAIAKRKDTGAKELMKLLESADSYTQFGAASGMSKRTDLSEGFLREALRITDNYPKQVIVQMIFSKKGISPDFLAEVRRNNSNLVQAALRIEREKKAKPLQNINGKTFKRKKEIWEKTKFLVRRH